MRVLDGDVCDLVSSGHAAPRLYICMYTYICIYTCICMCIHMHVYACIYICKYTCIYMYIHMMSAFSCDARLDCMHARGGINLLPCLVWLGDHQHVDCSNICRARLSA
jgi:hypothetical protein